MGEIAAARGHTEGTVVTYLLQAMAAGEVVRLEQFNIPRDHVDVRMVLLLLLLLLLLLSSSS